MLIKSAAGITKLANTCFVLAFVLLALELVTIAAAIVLRNQVVPHGLAAAIWAIGLILPTATCAAFLADSHIRPRPFRTTVFWVCTSIAVPILTVLFIIRTTGV